VSSSTPTMWLTLKPKDHVSRAKVGPIFGVAIGAHQPLEPEALFVVPHGEL